MTEDCSNNAVLHQTMTSETTRKTATYAQGISWLGTILRSRTVILTVAFMALIGTMYYITVYQSSQFNQRDTKEAKSPSSWDHHESSNIKNQRRKSGKHVSLQTGNQKNRQAHTSDDNRLSDLTTFLKEKIDNKQFSAICSAMEDHDVSFITNGRFKDSDWIGFSNVLKRCILYGTTTFWPFPEERLKCCIGSIATKLGVQFVQFASGVTYPSIAYKGKKLKDDLCYVVMSGMTKDPNDAKQLMKEYYSKCLFRGIDIHDEWFDHELQPDLHYDFNVLFDSEIEDNTDMMLEEALEVFKIKYSVLDYVLMNKNITALDAIKFVTNNRSPVICQFNAKVSEINGPNYNSTVLASLLHAFVDESDLVPIWAKVSPTFELFAINVIHPICRRRFIMSKSPEP